MTNKPIFQKRHYEAIALLLHEERNGDCVGLVDALAEKFIQRFMEDNANFQPGRFQDAVREGRLSMSTKNAFVGPAMPYYRGNAYEFGHLTRRSYKKG